MKHQIQSIAQLPKMKTLFSIWCLFGLALVGIISPIRADVLENKAPATLNVNFGQAVASGSLQYIGTSIVPGQEIGYVFLVNLSSYGFDNTLGAPHFIVHSDSGNNAGGGDFHDGDYATLYASGSPYRLGIFGGIEFAAYNASPEGRLLITDFTPVLTDLKKKNRNRPDKNKRGEPVQLATGAESRHRTLFSFNGARQWGFALSYNSMLALTQAAYPPVGTGWSHNFMASISSADGNLTVHWDSNSANVFTPTSADPSVYTSIEDGGLYDTIKTVSGGGWLLTHRDQSSLLFNASGQLVQDIDPHGHKLVLAYTGGQLTQIADPVSNTGVTLGYAGAMLQTVTDTSSATVGLAYATQSDGTSLLQSITDQNGKITTFGYDLKFQMATVTDNSGAVVLTNVNSNTGQVSSQQVGIPGVPPSYFGYTTLGLSGSTVYAPSDTHHLIPIVFSTPQLSSVTNSAGQTVNYTLDASNRIVSATLNSTTITVAYDSTGRAVSTTDAGNQTASILPLLVTNYTDHDGKSSNYIFDSNLNKLSEQDSFGAVRTYAYDASNNMTSIVDSLGRHTALTYDASGNVLTATDPAGQTTTYSYDTRNNLLTTTDPLSHVTTRTYDANNNLLTLTDALGRTTTWTYDTNSLPLTMTLPRGGIYHYSYTAGRLTQSTDPNGVVTAFDYDANGRLLHQTDALGKVTTYTYDGFGNLQTVKNALNQTTTYAYDYRNRVTSMTDPVGAVTGYTYDSNGNILTTTDALGKITTYTYDGEDRVKTVKDAINRTTTYAYDDIGRLASVTDPANNITSYEYDSADQLTAVVDALGKRTTSSYDVRGLLTGITDPLGRSGSFTYDQLGRRITARDPLNRLTSFGYDSLNRLQQVTDPGSLVAQQDFDNDGNRTSLTNPASAATTFAYDVGGRQTTTTTAAGHATIMAYDARSLLSTVTQPSTHSTTMSYDDAARLSGTTDQVGTINLTRDADGRVLTVREGSKTLSRIYDALGRLTSYTDGDGNVIGYAYDDIGRLSTLTYPDSKQVSYTYDTAGRLSTVTDWSSRVTTYSYDAVGRMTQLLRPNGTKQTRVYDAAGQLTQVHEFAPDGTTLLYSGDHSYDLTGQLTGDTIFPSITPVATAVAQTFDADNRLLTQNSAAVTFDADGNLLSIASGLLPAAYSYDARNRLTSAGGLTYTYDAENRRVALTDSTGTTHFVINPNAALDQVLVRTAPGGTKTFYVYGLGLLHEDNGSAVHYYHHDRRGDTIALTDNSGAVTDRASYGIYGELLARTGSTNTPFLFNGCWGVQSDPNGIYFHRARYYHPGIRRFLNQDSILGSIFIVGSLNRFSYANGNPVTSNDPFGLEAQNTTISRRSSSADLTVTVHANGVRTTLTLTDNGHIINSPAFTYTTVGMDSAAVAVLTQIGPISSQENVEYAGQIYSPWFSDDLQFTQPLTANKEAESVTWANTPFFSSAAADYHTHSGNSNGKYEDEYFSSEDIRDSGTRGIPSYLYTPSGNIYKYTRYSGVSVWDPETKTFMPTDWPQDPTTGMYFPADKP